MAFKNLFRLGKNMARLERLRSLSLFVDLTPRELVVVDALLHERSYLKDEVIFDEGEEGQAIYVIISGEVTICRQGDPVNGLIATLGPGAFFGDLALLDNGPRMAQARAATACDLIVFFREDFVTLFDSHPRLVWQFARHIGARMREMALAVGARQHL